MDSNEPSSKRILISALRFETLSTSPTLCSYFSSFSSVTPVRTLRIALWRRSTWPRPAIRIFPRKSRAAARTRRVESSVRCRNVCRTGRRKPNLSTKIDQVTQTRRLTAGRAAYLPTWTASRARTLPTARCRAASNRAWPAWTPWCRTATRRRSTWHNWRFPVSRRSPSRNPSGDTAAGRRRGELKRTRTSLWDTTATNRKRYLPTGQSVRANVVHGARRWTNRFDGQIGAVLIAFRQENGWFSDGPSSRAYFPYCFRRLLLPFWW